LGWIEKWGYRNADEVVGTMPNLGEHVAEVLGFPRPTHCIPMGVAENSFAEGESLADGYAEKYIPKGKFIVAHVGTIGITNALDTLLDCAQVMKHNQKVHFLLVGEGDLRAQYQQKYAHLSNLTFAPRVPKTMVQAVLRRCDLMYFSVHASKVWKFGQSLNKVIDYMLAGKPVVASYSGFPSMINEANCGSFVLAGDVQALRQEFERYLQMPNSLREAIGKRGRAWLLANRQYSKLAQDYQSILLDPAKFLSKA
jgi:glycosyltransferase involved in cell wall biosynthesis